MPPELYPISPPGLRFSSWPQARVISRVNIPRINESLSPYIVIAFVRACGQYITSSGNLFITANYSHDRELIRTGGSIRNRGGKVKKREAKGDGKWCVAAKPTSKFHTFMCELKDRDRCEWLPYCIATDTEIFSAVQILLHLSVL